MAMASELVAVAGTLERQRLEAAAQAAREDAAAAHAKAAETTAITTAQVANVELQVRAACSLYPAYLLVGC